MSGFRCRRDGYVGSILGAAGLHRSTLLELGSERCQGETGGIARKISGHFESKFVRASLPHGCSPFPLLQSQFGGLSCQTSRKRGR
jgi:hypothetical protein